MKILVSYRGIPQSPGWATGDMVVKAFRDLGHETFAHAKYYQENRWVDNPTATPSEFDLCLFMECNDGDPQYRNLKNVRARRTACWTFDNSYYQDRLQGLVDYFNFDFKFFANPLIVKEFIDMGYDNVHYLPYACDRTLHYRPPATPKPIDVAMIGSVRDDRIALVDHLNEIAKKDFHSSYKVELIGGLYREQYIDALASTKIIINQNPQAGRGLLNMRFWEGLAAGAYVITELADSSLDKKIQQDLIAQNQSYYDIENLSWVLHHILTKVQWDTPDFFHKGYTQNRVLTEHAYHNRCQSIIEMVFANERT